MKKFYAYDVINYVDDVCAFSTPSQSEKLFQTLYTKQYLLTDLGFKLSVKQLVSPSTRVSCLGIIFDIEKFTMSIPEEKIQKIRQLCEAWLNKDMASKGNFSHS